MKARAREWLLRQQDSDSAWRDFDLADQHAGGISIGPSDQWVTAYTALAMLESADRSVAARRGAALAADWLDRQRTYPAGWGYNGRSGPDTDSTAHAVLLFARLGRTARPADEALLFSALRDDGGFATFPGAAGGWGDAHTDVTPRAVAALPKAKRREVLPRVIRFLQGARRPDGTWPSYWWSSCLYPTCHAAALLAEAGVEDVAAPLAVATETPIELALAAAVDACRGHHAVAARRIAALASLQHSDGSWSGSCYLRVPARDGGDAPRYADRRSIFTTATVLSALAFTAHSMRTGHATFAN